MLIEELRLSNLLSFGPDTVVPLGALNVVIGANGSGKSNLLAAIDLLRHAPGDIAKPIREGGGIREWLWKGGAGTPVASIEAIVDHPDAPATLGYEMPMNLRYVLSFVESAQRVQIIDERIENIRGYSPAVDAYRYYDFKSGKPVLKARNPQRELQPTDIDLSRSILAQRRDSDQYPEITFLSLALQTIVGYREWSFGRHAAVRSPQRADMPNAYLAPDASNLGLILNFLRRSPAVKGNILAALKQLYSNIEDFDVQIEGGTVQVFLQEGNFTIPATRLSDGTLRYLCLLAILCHPNPPPLVCIEEPELGLHPDILPTLADLLRDASQRCQLIVTTHSDVLVDAMTDTPECVMVCEKHDGATTFRRLSADALKPWLERYRLGELWLRGDIGGTRW